MGSTPTGVSCCLSSREFSKRSNRDVRRYEHIQQLCVNQRFDGLKLKCDFLDFEELDRVALRTQTRDSVAIGEQLQRAKKGENEQRTQVESWSKMFHSV